MFGARPIYHTSFVNKCTKYAPQPGPGITSRLWSVRAGLIPSRLLRSGLTVRTSGGTGGRPPGRKQQGLAKAILGDPPEIVLHAVHERDRDLLPVLAQIRRRLRDVTFLPRHTEVISHLGDD